MKKNKNIVNGNAFLNLPDGTEFRDIDLNTNKPIGGIAIKSGLRKDAFGDKVMGYYFKEKVTGEESSAFMPRPSACKFLIIRNTMPGSGESYL